LHVRDVSHGDTEAQSQDVTEVLRELGIAPEDARLLEVWNKLDAVDTAERQRLENLQHRQPTDRRPVLVSALTGEGIERLAAAIEARLAQTRLMMELALDPSDGAGASWLHRHAEGLAKEMRDDGRLAVTVRVDPGKAGLVRAKFGAAVAHEGAGTGR